MSEPRKYVLHFPEDYKPTASKHPAYGQWAAIKSRCTNRKFDYKKRYVWRGIKMCDRWRNGEGDMSGFECFYADMGPRPTRKHSVERKDNDGDYSPVNCKWATNKEQSNNRSNNRKITYLGETLSMMSTAEKYGVNYYVLRNRITRGWPVEDAIIRPLGDAAYPRRPAIGAALPQTVLREDEVRSIREIYAKGGITMASLAASFGICPANVCLIVNRKSWKHLD